MLFRKTCFASGVVAMVAALAGLSTALGQQPLPVLDYLAGRAARMAADLPPLPATLDAWKAERKELVAKLETTLSLPDRQPMKAAVTYARQRGDLTVEEVAYLWADQTYVSANVIRNARADGRQPAIVIPSGWLGHYTFATYRKFVDSLASQGFVVLFIDDPRTGRRQAPRAGLYAAASAAGTQVAGVQVFDALRGLDYVLTRDDVDPKRIGIAGLAEGAMQAYLAAALEERFRFVAAVAGTTTYEALAAATAAGKGPEDPSAFVAGILRFADMDRLAACVAPRPLLVAGSFGDDELLTKGYDRVLRTLKSVYGLYETEERLCRLPDQGVEDTTPYVGEIGRWFAADVFPTRRASKAATLPSGKPEDLDFDIMHYLQHRIADAATSPDAVPSSKTQWQASRQQTRAWLDTTCGLKDLRPAPDKVVDTSEADGLVTERLALGIDADLLCPAVLVRPAETAGVRHAAVVLSHDDRQCAAEAKIAEAARQLAAAGYWVIVPEHASAHPQSPQPLADPQRPSFYGDETARFYGPADLVGLPPLALRVADDLAAVRHLAARGEVDPARIVLAGLGLGGVDAALAAVLDERIAGVASIDATTLRDWAVSGAPGESRFLHMMPYLPSMLGQIDFDGVYAALAPRPLTVVRLKNGWPRSGFEQCANTASAAYRLGQASGALLALGPRGITEELQEGLPEGLQKQLVAAAGTPVPRPPRPGIVGTPEGLTSRRTVDSASGLVWIVAEMSGFDQELIDGGYELQTWSFFNDNGDAQKGRAITPLLLHKKDNTYTLLGIGKTRLNTGTGLQSFPFEPVDGYAVVREGCFFGWHTGDAQGKTNPGVVEFEDAPDCQMVILAPDGQTPGPGLTVGTTLREQARYPRQYSVMAVSKKRQ